ncbi:MAG: FecR domain-containing protein, partial [Myxococcota bacterium]
MDEEKLFELGAEVSAAQDAVDSTAVLARARTGVLSASVGRKKSRGASLRLGLAAAALGAGAVAALLFSFADSELSFEVDGQPAEVGTFIRAEEQARTIFFADASRLSLHRGSHARVLEAGKERARVLIERGGADVYVTPGLGREWSVAVGPFEVRVVGTSFGVRWTPEERRFDLELRTGEVRVTGPMLGDGRSLRAGQSLVVLLEEGRVELHDGALPARVRTEAGDPPVTPSDAPFEPVPEEPVEVPEVSPVVVRRPSEERASRTQRADEPEGEAEEPSPDIEEPAPPTWRELARAGRYQDALAEADIEAILASGDAG